LLASPSNSIDYAVMEKTDQRGRHSARMPAGTTSAPGMHWQRIGQADGNGNTQRGDVLSVDSRTIPILVSLTGRLLATVGDQRS
jgi:mannose-1-phosphate guanylyltransferase